MVAASHLGEPNALFWLAAQTGRVCPNGKGKPGVGKTASIKVFCRATGRKPHILIGSLREPSDIGGYPYPHQVEVNDPITGNRTVVYMALMPPKWAADCWDGGKWLIFLDELTGNAPAVQAAMLAVIAEKRVGDLQLPDDVWICAACNSVEDAANGFELEPPMANRLMHLPWETDQKVITEGFAAGFDFAAPRFPVLPEDWQNHLTSAGGRIAAFFDRFPNLMEAYPSERTLQVGAWPSPRSWHMGGMVMAALEACEAPKNMRYNALRACVGEAATQQFKGWEDALDLPDPEAWIAEAIAARAEQRDLNITMPPRSDQIMACLTSVAGRVMSHGRTDKGPAKHRWEAAADVYTLALQEHKELCVATARSLYQEIPDGVVAPVELNEAFHSILKAIGRLS